MKALLGLIALFVCDASTLRSEDAPKRDDSLRALVRDSTLIIDADVLQPYLYGNVDGDPIATYSVIVRVRETLFGHARATEGWVRVSGQPWDYRTQPTCLQTRQRCVFFLRPDDTGSVHVLGAGQLASAQRYRPELVSAVRRLIKSK